MSASSPAEGADATADQPGVSVVIATRNRPDQVRVAVRGVLGQDYRGRIECLVVHDRTDPDGSLTDLAGEAGWPGPRQVTVLTNDRAPGLAGGRNTGILSADSPWIAFCDDDDEWHPTKLAEQFAALRTRPADLCVTGVEVAYDDRTSTRLVGSDTLALEQLVDRRVMAAHPSTVLVRSQHLQDRVGLVDEAIPGSYAEDYDFMLRAAAAGPITVADAPLVTVHWGGSQFSKDWSTIVSAIDYLIAKHPELANSSRGMARLQGRRAFCLAALGRGKDARRSAITSVRLSATEPRGYLAMLVSVHPALAPRVLDLAHRRGRGI